MASDSAQNQEQETHVDISIAGETGDWAKMTPAERETSVNEAYAEVAAKRGMEVPAATNETKPAGDETPGDEANHSAAGDETPVSDDAAQAETAEGEGETEGQDWLDQDTLDFAKAYGLDETFLAAIPSREVLDRVFQAIDKRAFEEGQKPPETPESAAAQKPVVQTKEKPAEPPPASPGDPFGDMAKFKLGDQFDEEAAKPINAFMEAATSKVKSLEGTIKALEGRLAEFETDRRQQAVADLRRRATDSLHSLGHAELFGKPGETPTREQAANIEKAIDAHFTHARGLVAQGRQAAPTKAFLKAAVQLAFGDQLSKQQEKQLVDRVKKQAARRTGGGSAKPLPKQPPQNETQREMAARIASDPEVMESFNALATGH